MSAREAPPGPADGPGVVITEELARRTSRVPDYQVENRALLVLADAMARTAQSVLEGLCEQALQLCGADSAGISVLEGEGPEAVFRWSAIAGPFAANAGQTLPAEASPCGLVVRSGSTVLMDRPGRAYPALAGLEPAIHENLLVPFQVRGQPAGTVWAIAHRPERKFDAEDARRLGSIARFAAIACAVLTARAEAESGRLKLEQVAARTLEHEERQRLILECARDYAIFTSDPDGVIDSWPTGAQAVYGWSPDEAIGRPTDMLFVEEDRATGEPQKELGQARDTGMAPDVRWHLRKSGERIFIDGATRVLRDREGALRGFLKIGQDVTERRRAEAALRESEERFRTLATNIPQLVFRSRGNGERTWGSPQWERFAGLSDAESRGFGWLKAIHPEDRPATMDAWTEAEARGEYYSEHRVRGTDGNYRWFQTRATPLRDPIGTIVEWFGTSSDIHDIRQLQEQQRMLVSELQHRTRNLLAVVHSVMWQTLEASSSLDDFAQRFSGRLSALGRAQGLLARPHAGSVTIADLLQTELSGHGAEPDQERLRLDGPAVMLPRRLVQTLALAIHELATNALKHGALSRPSGKLSINWAVQRRNADGQELLVLDWSESGVTLDPAAHPPPRGYGRELIEDALPYELDAETRLEFTPDGVVCRVMLPLA